MAPIKSTANSTAPIPRRSARLAGVIADPDARISKTTLYRKPAATKKPRLPPVTYECSTCCDDLLSRSFPDELCSPGCTHLINTCKKCIKAYVTHQLDNNTIDHIHCPECSEDLDKSFVRKYGTVAAYKRWIELERHMIAEKTPGWRWCLGRKCSAGQVHEPSIANENMESPEGEDRNFTCNDCGYSCCILCNRAKHTGTCDDERNHEEAASLVAVQAVSKPCPGCERPIEKTHGCDSVVCSKCHTQFCYVCRAKYSTAPTYGQITHADGCLYTRVADPHAVPARPPGAGDPFAEALGGW